MNRSLSSKKKKEKVHTAGTKIVPINLLLTVDANGVNLFVNADEMLNILEVRTILWEKISNN